MSLEIVYGDICETDCDVLVNASNGIGYMGGKAGIRKRLPGVAESIHYLTAGQVEAEAKAVTRSISPLGVAPGNVFVTAAPGLKCRHIIHAVTMRLPGTLSRMSTVVELLPRILQQARQLGASTIAIPLLGTGTGHLSQEKVLELYHSAFDQVEDPRILVYLYRK